MDQGARLATELEAAYALDEVERLAALVRVREQLDADIAVQAAAFDGRASFGEKGYRSPAGFLVEHCRISRSSARKLQDTGRALKNFPLIAAAAQSGEISFDHARVFAKTVVPPRTDSERIDLASEAEHKFLAKAKTHTADDFQKLVCLAWRQIANESDREAQQRIVDKTEVTFEEFPEEDTARIVISGPRIEVRMIRNALRRLTDELWRKENQADDDTVVPMRHRKARQFRAAVLMAKRAMARSAEDLVLPEPLLNVQMDWDTYEREVAAYAAGEPGPGANQIFEYGYRSQTLDDIPMTPAHAFAIGIRARLRRLVIDAKSRKVDLGRAERLYTGAAREAVMQRDRHCQHPGCDMPGVWCDVDHILEWSDGGETSPENGQLLCRWHHTRKSTATISNRKKAA